MILSETSVEEFPGDGDRLYPTELYSPFADHLGVYLIKQSQF